MAEGFHLDSDTGKFLVDDDGFAVDEECCCGCDPCADAGEDGSGTDYSQDDLEVTISGSCGDQSDCGDFAGTYEFDSFDDNTCCWTYYHSTSPGRTLIVCDDGGCSIYRDEEQYRGTVTITCDAATHKLTITGTLSGIDQSSSPSGYDCSGCSASVGMA